MRRLVFAQLSLYLVLLTQSLPGQESPTSVTPVQSERPPVLVPSEVAELEIALGRLRLVPDRFKIVRKHEQWPLDSDSRPVEKKSISNAADNQRQEPANAGSPANGQRSYQVSAAEGRPALRLCYGDAQEKWSVHIDCQVGAQWTRQYRQDGQDIHVEYTQKPHQPISIEIIEGTGAPVRIQGQTLWHLTEQASPQFDKYVLPSLSRLNSSWDLPKALASAKRMRDQSRTAARLGEHQLAQYLADLDSSDHRIRQLAKQKMSEAGLSAQIPLEKLRQGRLSPQQRSTIDELLAGLEPRSADTPTRLAYWLAGDPNFP